MHAGGSNENILFFGAGFRAQYWCHSAVSGTQDFRVPVMSCPENSRVMVSIITLYTPNMVDPLCPDGTPHTVPADWDMCYKHSMGHLSPCGLANTCSLEDDLLNDYVIGQLEDCQEALSNFLEESGSPESGAGEGDYNKSLNAVIIEVKFMCAPGMIYTWFTK